MGAFIEIYELCVNNYMQKVTENPAELLFSAG